MDNDKAIEDINSLVEINNDRIEGYRKASEETKDTDLRNLFNRFMKNSQQFRNELIEEVRRLGGEPAEGTRTSGKLYRVFMDLKAALSGDDRKTVLNSCEYGEDTAVDAYKDVLDDQENSLSSEQQNMIRSQYMVIKKDHDAIKTMRDNLVEEKSE